MLPPTEMGLPGASRDMGHVRGSRPLGHRDAQGCNENEHRGVCSHPSPVSDQSPVDPFPSSLGWWDQRWLPHPLGGGRPGPESQVLIENPFVLPAVDPKAAPPGGWGGIDHNHTAAATEAFIHH